MSLASNLISGFVNKDVDNIKPSSGVALPVRFVLPADTVMGILLLILQVKPSENLKPSFWQTLIPLLK